MSLRNSFIVLFLLSLTIGCSKEDTRTPQQVLEESDQKPRNFEFQVALCVETEHDVVPEDKLELTLQVGGGVSALWVDKERNAGKVHFTRANKVRTYCTWLMTETDVSGPIRKVTLDLTEMRKDVVVTAVRACASHSESKPTKDINNRLHAPCYDLSQDEHGKYRLVMLQDNNNFVGGSTVVVVGRRKQGDPSLLP